MKVKHKNQHVMSGARLKQMMQMPEMASRQQSPQLTCDAQGAITLNQSFQPTIQ
jgi:hypothetical protein